MIRFRSHSVTTIVVLFLLTFLEGSSWGSACAFAACSPASLAVTCSSFHAEGVEPDAGHGNGTSLCRGTNESVSANCSCENEYVAATNVYRNPSPTLDSPRDLLSSAQVNGPSETPSHEDCISEGMAHSSNPSLAALSTVVLLN
jgi:hypothetical protein